jgi:hypothetical protein
VALTYGARSRQRGDRPRGEEYGARGGGASTTGGTESRGGPLGVPKGYTAAVQRSWTPSPGRSGRVNTGALRYTYEQRPRYMDGDEWRPATRAVDEIVEMQQKLVIAGYLDANDGFRLGMWDGPTRTAYRYLLEDSNASGLDADTMLYRAAQGIEIGGGGGGAGGGGGGRGRGGYMIDPETGELIPIPQEQFIAPPMQVRTTNPDDLRRVFRSAVIDKLGVGWSQKEIDELVQAYNWKELQVQADAYRQEVARMEQEFNYELGGPKPTTKQITSVDVASPEAFIEEEARRRDPGGFQATQMAEDYAPAFFDALGGYV